MILQKHKLTSLEKITVKHWYSTNLSFHNKGIILILNVRSATRCSPAWIQWKNTKNMFIKEPGRFNVSSVHEIMLKKPNWIGKAKFKSYLQAYVIPEGEWEGGGGLLSLDTHPPPLKMAYFWNLLANPWDFHKFAVTFCEKIWPPTPTIFHKPLPPPKIFGLAHVDYKKVILGFDWLRFVDLFCYDWFVSFHYYEKTMSDMDVFIYFIFISCNINFKIES